MVSLRNLIADGVGVVRVVGDADTPITAPVVESDAEVQAGGVFVARRGLSSDGHRFIPRAIERGAAAIVGERDEVGDLPVPYVQVTNAQEAVGYLAAAYHGYPSRHLLLVGVTGTDGKTTTSTLIHSILQQATGGKAGLISTVAALIGRQSYDTGFHVTTPGAPQIQAFLAEMVKAGLTHCVLEMTSHGLAQGRLNGVDVDVAVLTNVTHEHLDYHGTFEAYRDAKSRMFAMLAASHRKAGLAKISVINGEDANAAFFAAFAADRRVMYVTKTDAIYGIATANVAALRVEEVLASPVQEGEASHYPYTATDYVVAREIAYTPSGTTFTLAGIGQLTTALVGAFNVQNALAATATAQALGVNAADIQRGVAAVKAIAGRMERIDEGQAFTAIVDFAHTPNALKNALLACRAMLPAGGRLITVFGCAGLRDREKRVLMPTNAAQFADFAVLTAEDPRTESLDAILAVMAEACTKAGGVEGQTFTRVPDRGAALAYACQMARAGDIVVACGKGHEQSMCFGTQEYAWDDREALRAALRGAPLRTLPTAKNGG